MSDDSNTTLTSPEPAAGEETQAAETPQNVLPFPTVPAKRPRLPSYTAEQLRDMGVIVNPTEFGVFVEIPFAVQKRIVEDASGFGFIAASAVDQVIKNALATLGLTGNINVKTEPESFAFQAWTDSREVAPPKPEAAQGNSHILTTDELLRLHEDTCAAARDIMRSKNHDYTDGSVDPFANFRTAETLGVPAEVGVLIRCLDKFKRIQTFVNKGELKVKGESVADAIQDVINYMILVQGIILGR